MADSFGDLVTCVVIENSSDHRAAPEWLSSSSAPRGTRAESAGFFNGRLDQGFSLYVFQSASLRGNGSDHPIDEAHPQRLARIDCLSRRDHFQGRRQPDQPREPLGPAKAWKNPEPDLGQRKAGSQMRTGNACMTRQRKLESSAKAGPLDSGYKRLLSARHGVEKLVHFRHELVNWAERPLFLRLVYLF